MKTLLELSAEVNRQLGWEEAKVAFGRIVLWMIANHPEIPIEILIEFTQKFDKEMAKAFPPSDG